MKTERELLEQLIAGQSTNKPKEVEDKDKKPNSNQGNIGSNNSGNNSSNTNKR